MSKMTFGISDVFNKETIAYAKDTHKVVYIPFEEIHRNPLNEKYYTTKDIEFLAAGIAERGLLQPLEVIQENENSYRIIGGNRRHEAIELLIKNGDTSFDTVPCFVETVKDEDDEEERLIDSNIYNRNKTDAEIARELEGKKKFLTQRKKNGETIRGNLLKLVSEQMNISFAQAKKLNSINQNASEEVKKSFDDGDLSLQAAFEFSKYDEETQKEIFADEANSDEPITAKKVKEKAKEKAEKTKEPKEDTEDTDETQSFDEDVNEVENADTSNDFFTFPSTDEDNSNDDTDQTSEISSILSKEDFEFLVAAVDNAMVGNPNKPLVDKILKKIGNNFGFQYR
jgi:ParB-like chromosome segregation protein Spo0J